MSRADLRAALEDALRAEAGVVTISRLCPRCGSSSHGRPWARRPDGAPTYVSMSYAGPLAAVAWSVAGPVGIDLERASPDLPAGWTRTEALLKTTGDGLTHWPDVTPADLPDLPTATLQLPAGWVGTVAGVDVSWRLVDRRTSPDRSA